MTARVTSRRSDLVRETKKPLDCDQATLRMLLAAPSALKLGQMRNLPKLRTAYSQKYPYVSRWEFGMILSSPIFRRFVMVNRSLQSLQHLQEEIYSFFEEFLFPFKDLKKFKISPLPV